MIEVIFLISLALVWIIFATIQDLKTKEVANWLSFSLIIFALGFRFFYCLFSLGNFNFFYQGLIGLGIFFVIGNLLYYGRMFAGGDAKLMISLGAILPLSETFMINLKIFIWFFVIFLFVGAVYGLTVSGVLAFRNFGKFKREFSRQLKKNKKLVLFVFSVGIIIMFLGFIEKLFIISGALVFLFPYFYLSAKSIEKTCMIKKIKTSQLREGDWLVHDVKIGSKFIKANWEGVSKKDIGRIKKKYKEVEIKQGIAFIPVFLISFLILIGINWLWKGLF